MAAGSLWLDKQISLALASMTRAIISARPTTRQVELGGIEPPSAGRALTVIRPFPVCGVDGSRAAGSGGPRSGPATGSVPRGQRSFPPPVVCPYCLRRFCCRAAVDWPRVPLPVAVLLLARLIRLREVDGLRRLVGCPVLRV